jgi:peptidoglycan/xylan/chitin deacetylase (PgdA/CDA1 family)
MRRNRFGVLAYHRVGVAAQDPWGLNITPQYFDEQLTALDELGTIVRFGDGLGDSAGSRFRSHRPRFSITFDDGYVDNLRNAVELLERHDAPATIFIATGFIDQPAFWWDVLAEMALESTATPAQLGDAAERRGLITREQAEAVAHDRRAMHDQLYWSLVVLPTDGILTALTDLAEGAGIRLPVPVQRPLTTEELLDLGSHPLVTIGAHTVSHPRLTCLKPDDAHAEIVNGNQRLDELFGPQERVFAYPYGNTDSAVTAVVRRCGFRYALTTDPRWVGAREDPLLIPRLTVPDVNGAALTKWLRSS